MNFREEYKKSAEIIAPSAEALQRMKSNVLEKINTPAKKVFPWKKISAIGGSVAACAVIGVAAVRFIPQSMNSTDMTAASMSSVAMAESAADAADAGNYGILTDKSESEKMDAALDQADEINSMPADSDHPKSVDENAPEQAISAPSASSAPSTTVATPPENTAPCEEAGDAAETSYQQIIFNDDMSGCTYGNKIYSLDAKLGYYDNTSTALAGIVCEDRSSGMLYLVEFNSTELYISELKGDFIGVFIKAE